MSNYSTKRKPSNVSAPIRTTGDPLPTHEGGRGFERDVKSALFLLAVSLMVGEGSFYESGGERLARFRSLIHQVVSEDASWAARFVPYLRNTMQVRTVSVVAACEYVKAGGPHGRKVIDSACSRPDEPAEVLAYWYTEYGRKIPMAVKRGVADAVVRLYNERAALKYDGKSRAWRMGDVVELVHPKPKTEQQSVLFRYLLDARHNPDDLRATPSKIAEVRDWAEAGAPLTFHGQDSLPDLVTWERLSGYRKMDREAWEAVIPQMGYMALLRNLRNFDEAGVSDEVAGKVMARLSDPEEVARSRQFPIRFFSAHKSLSSLRWGPVLEKALQYSLANVPSLPGRTLILVDVSGSMQGYLSDHSTATWGETSSLFGSALALRAESAQLVAYSRNHQRIAIPKGGAVLKVMQSCWSWPGAGGGTLTFQALADTYDDHDRVVILTDEQAHYGPDPDEDSRTRNIPRLYTFNLAGYRAAHTEQGEKGRYAFGGLTDAGFKVIELLEAQREGEWPF